MRYILLSIINVFFDLLSIAYLIPLFIFILDKDQIPDLFKKISFFNESHITIWVVGIIILFIIKNYIQIAIIKFQSVLVFDIATNLSSKLTKQFLQKPYSYIQNLNKGKEIQKIQMSGTDFANHILLSLNTLFTEIIMIGIIAVISFVLYPKFSILIFFLSTICLYALFRIRKKQVNQISKSIQTSYSKSTSDLLNIIDGFLEIKSLRKESYFQKKFKDTLATFNTNFAILKKHQGSNAKYLEVFIIIGLSFFLYYINTSFNTSSEKALLIAYVAGVSLKLFPSLNKIIIAYTNFKSFNYTIAVFSEKNETLFQKNKFNHFDKSLSLQNVSFSYTKKNTLLKGINLTINKSEIIGVKGRSGIGKTTLLNIIMGLIKPESGTILLDGSKIERQNTLFTFIGYVPQQPFLFQESLLNNIVMNEDSKNIDFERLDTLISIFELTDFVSNLSNGIHTKITHDALSVSGGQKQRIAIIRALYAQPQLLILDEVTNQLDEELEEKVLFYLKKYVRKENIAIVLVSHASVLLDICDQSYEISKNTLKKLN